MSPAWLLQALAAGALLGTGALAAERVAGWFGLPRRAIWAAAMLGSLALPALALWAPGLLPDLGIVPDPPSAAPGPDIGALFPFADAAAGPLAAGPVPDAGAWWQDLSVVLGLGWLASSLAVLGAVAWTYRRLRAVRAGSVPMEVDGTAVRVAESAGPAVIGLLRPAVVVPRWTLDLPAEERRLILLHEREHVSHGDPWLLFLGTLALAAMPWSLPLWWQHRRLRAATETDCDARVLARGASRRDYGRVLIRTAGTSPSLPLLGPAWGDSTSQLERRIMTMTAKRPSHRALRAVPLLALTTGVVAAACGVVGKRGPAAPPEPATAPSVADAAAPAAPVPSQKVLVDTVTVSRGSAPAVSSTGFLPAFPVRLDTTATFPRVRTVDHFKVGKVLDGGSASRAGLRAGDVILTVNGLDSRELGTWKSLTSQRPGTRYVLRVRRGSEEREITARLDPPGSTTARSPAGAAAQVLVDTVQVSPGSYPPRKSSPGWVPGLPVQLDTTSTRPNLRTVDPLKVGKIRPGADVSRAGLRVDDVVLTLNGLDSRELRAWTSLTRQPPGTPYVLRIRRGSEEREITARLEPPTSWP